MNSRECIYEAASRGYSFDVDGGIVSPHGVVLRAYTNSRGYLTTNIRIHGKGRRTKTFCVHRLAGYLKFGESMFATGIEVRHLDSDSANNRCDNIGIGTHSENMMDMDAPRRLEHARHASSFMTKYSHSEVIQFYKENGWRKTLEQFGMSKGGLSYIVNSSMTASAADS